jgi:hypothetical protein
MYGSPTIKLLTARSHSELLNTKYIIYTVLPTCYVCSEDAIYLMKYVRIVPTKICKRAYMSLAPRRARQNTNRMPILV